MNRFEGKRKATIVLTLNSKELSPSYIRIYSRSESALLEAVLSGKEKVAIDDELKAWYVSSEASEGEKELLATVSIYSIPYIGDKIKIYASDLFRSPLKNIVKAAGWRKATVKEILEDVFSLCGVKSYDLSHLPDITLCHFSYFDMTGWAVLREVIAAVYIQEKIKLDILPSKDGKLMIGKIQDIIPEPLNHALSEDEIILEGEDFIKLHTVPLLYGQEVTVKDKAFKALDVIHTVSHDKREVDAWIM